MLEWRELGKATDISKGGLKRYDIDQIRVLVVHLDDGYYAIQDDCPHMRVSLSYGTLKDDVIICALHKAEINIKTGKVIKAPHVSKVLNLTKMGKLMTDIIVNDVKTYPVKIEGDNLYIQI